MYVGNLGDPDSDILVPASNPARMEQAMSMPICPVSTSAMHRKGNQYAFIDFIRNECLSPGKKPGPWPYFTDVVKCGLNPKPLRSKGKIIHKLRGSYCIDHLMVDQIHIIQPRIIAV